MTADEASIEIVTAADLDELLPLMGDYCVFYETPRSPAELRPLCEALLADPQRDGIQLIARDDVGAAVGFATIFWSWSTVDACRIAIMNDLFVAGRARGRGIADALIAACAERAREHGAGRLEWQTAPDNLRAQTVYDRVGGTRSQWLDYSLAL